MSIAIQPSSALCRKSKLARRTEFDCYSLVKAPFRQYQLAFEDLAYT